MRRFQRFIERHASARRLVVLVALLAMAMLSVHVIDTPWSLVRLRSMTGGLGILDMELHYSGRHAYDLLTALGPGGRSFYLWRMLAALDVVLPVLFAAVLSVGMAVGFRGLIGEQSRIRRLQVLPLIALAADYSENVLIAFLLLRFPVEHSRIAALAGWVTTTKQLAYAASIIVCIAAGAARWRTRR